VRGIHDKPGLLFSGNHNHFRCSAWPDVDTADQPMEPQRPDYLQLRGRTFQVLIGQPMRSRAETWSCRWLHAPPCNCCAVNWQGVSLAAKRVVYRGVAELSRCTLGSEAHPGEGAALIRSKAVELRPSLRSFRGRCPSALWPVETFRTPAGRPWATASPKQLLRESSLADLRFDENTLIFSAHATGEHPELEIETRPVRWRQRLASSASWHLEAAPADGFPASRSIGRRARTAACNCRVRRWYSP